MWIIFILLIGILFRKSIGAILPVLVLALGVIFIWDFTWWSRALILLAASTIIWILLMPLIRRIYEYYEDRISFLK